MRKLSQDARKAPADREPRKGLRLLTETLMPLVSGGGGNGGGASDPTSTNG